MAIEIPAGREDLRALLAPLNHADTAAAVRAERTLSRVFGGSCQVPLAAYATVGGDQLHMRAMVGTPDGQRIARAEASGPTNAPEALGERVAAALDTQGAAAILVACKVDA
jgi:hydroxymethylbilane synthase